MTCPQCLSGTGPDVAFCVSCERPAASASQFPRTPGDRSGWETGAYLAVAAAALAALPAVLPAFRSRHGRR